MQLVRISAIVCLLLLSACDRGESICGWPEVGAMGEGGSGICVLPVGGYRLSDNQIEISVPDRADYESDGLDEGALLDRIYGVGNSDRSEVFQINRSVALCMNDQRAGPGHHLSVWFYEGIIVRIVYRVDDEVIDCT